MPLRDGALWLPHGHPALRQLATSCAPLTLDDVAPVASDRAYRDRVGLRQAPRHVAAGGSIVDATVRPPAAPIRSGSIKLRPYQAAAVDAWRQAQGDGVVEAPCGAGKTEIGCAVVRATSTPALVLVNSGDLVAQWTERIRLRLDLAPVLVESPAAEGRVMIATFQRLARWSASERLALGRRVGLVVVDEAHHVPARSWGQVMLDLPARHRLLLTATPDRLDGLRPLLHLHGGPLRYRVRLDVLQASGATLAPEVRRVDTGWRPGKDAGNKRASSRARNQKIVDIVQAEVAEGRRVLVLVRLVAHAERLAAMLRRLGVAAAPLVGTVGPIERATRLGAMRSGALRVLVATQLADEGLDLPELDTVVLGSHSESEGRTTQRIGRGGRPMPGKARPRVYDLVDRGDDEADAWQARAELYLRNGWTVTA